MGDSILAGNLTVYWSDENRRKQIRWTGGTLKTDVETMIDIYGATEDLLTLPANQNQGLIFSAETPGEYTVGKIDSGELDPWFVDLATMQHVIGDYKNFTGCAVKTAGWKRDLPGDGTGNTGIVVIKVAAAGAIVIGDIGNDIVHADGDVGTLLDVVVTGGASDYLFVRPDSNALVNDFDSAIGNLTCNVHVSVQEGAAITGEMIWGNPYTKGGIQIDTHVFLFQDGGRVTKLGSSIDDFWDDGHMDRPLPITDWKTTDFPIIDEGYLTVYARKYGTKNSYDLIRMNTTTGGNVTAALGSGIDGNNTTGYASITLSGETGNWNVGDEISGDVSGARAVLTLVAGSIVHFYYVGDPMIVFDGSEAITNEDDTGAATGSSAVSDQGPALATWFEDNIVPTIAFANVVGDIDDDGTDEPYGIKIDINQAFLAEMYEWTKYIQMRNSTFDMDGLDGQEWLGIDYRINYATITGTVPEGSVVTGAVSGAVGTIVSHDTTNDVVLLRNSRGTFVDGERIYETDGVNEFVASGLTVKALTPILENSLCTKAGSLIIGAVGVLLDDYRGTEANSFQCYDANGVLREQPTLVSMDITNLLVADWASCHKLTGSGADTDKVEFTAYGTGAIGDAQLDVDAAVTADKVGKTAGGRFIFVDVSDSNREYVLRFDSWSNIGGTGSEGRFVLSNILVTAEALTNDTDIIDTGVFADAQVGDLVLNTSRANAVSYIKEIVSDDKVIIYPPITGQVSGDIIEINALPVIPEAADKLFIAVILSYVASGTSKSATMQYIGTIYTRVRVRNTSDATVKIKGFTADIAITSGGGAAVATRITNPVYGA